MLLLSIFLFSALLAVLSLQAPLFKNFVSSEPRAAGISLIGATLLPTAFGWAAFHLFTSGVVARGWEQMFLLPVLVAALYVAAVVRERTNLPIWIADLAILGVAYLSLQIAHGEAIRVLSSPASSGYVSLGKWALPLSLLWMWAIARMTAAINRAPQVTGGYLGLVALALLILLKLKGDVASHFFAFDAAAALAGAGLATVPLAIRRRDFNIGWPAALALGFLLSQIATIGLLKGETFFILLFSLIAFGLPLLDVSFFRVRAALRGQSFDVQEQRLRLQEALERRGVAPLKIALLYFVMAAWLCGLGVLAARFLFATSAPLWLLLLCAVLLFALFFVGLVLFISLARVLMRRGEGEVIPEEIEAFGVRISPVSMSEALDKIEGFIRSGTPHHVVTSDANSILRAQEDEEYAAIVRRAALIAPDGFGVVWGARLLNLPIYERVTGVDMVTGICERAAKAGHSIYILGSEPGIAATAAEKLAERYLGLRIAGTQHGFWKRENLSDEEVVQRIHDAKPDVLFVAFGIPAQEKFIARHFEALGVPVSLGVGGSFDVYSEKLRRAPEYIQRSGLEWIYRVWQEPWRWKRMSYVPRFMLFALRVWIFGSRPTPPPKP